MAAVAQFRFDRRTWRVGGCRRFAKRLLSHCLSGKLPPAAVGESTMELNSPWNCASCPARSGPGRIESLDSSCCQNGGLWNALLAG